MTTGLVIDGVTYTGTIQLVAGEGIKITATESSGKVVVKIEKDKDISSALKTINGVKPDTSGNILLKGIDCVKVEKGQNSISLTNTCSTPCCSDTDNTSSQILAQIATIKEEQQMLLDTINGMQPNLNYIQASLLSLASNQ